MRLFDPIRNGFKRQKIRRLYNAGKMTESRKEAMEELSRDTPNKSMAQDIVIRSLYNQGKWDELLTFVELNPGSDPGNYANRARIKLSSSTSYVEPEPMIHKNKIWDEDNLLENWYQEGERLWLRHPWGWVYWDMPEDFALEDTSPNLLHLALEVLLSPWIPKVKRWKPIERKAGAGLALSYSGGIDSTAALLLLPDETILAYHLRDFVSMLDHSIPKRTFQAIQEKMERKVLCIPSNHERIRLAHGLNVGFSSANAAGVHLILLADYLDLKGIAFGTPIDNTWLKSGRTFRDFSQSHYWKYWEGQFSKAGLSYVLPINHISEAGAMEICKQSVLSESVNSCLRGVDGKWCGKCWKCFHKNGPLGRKIDPHSKEITTFLSAKPLRTAQHALWALQKQNLQYLAPQFNSHFDSDLSWWSKAYGPGIEIIQMPWRSGVSEKTNQYLDWMDPPYSLQNVALDV